MTDELPKKPTLNLSIDKKKKKEKEKEKEKETGLDMTLQKTFEQTDNKRRVTSVDKITLNTSNTSNISKTSIIDSLENI